MKVFVIGGSSVLGSRDGRVVTGFKFKTGTNLNSKLFTDYFMAKNVGEFIEVEVGDGKEILTISLSDEQQIELDTVKQKFKVAKKKLDGWLLNTVYKDLFTVRVDITAGGSVTKGTSYRA